jgi:hypothetical protein
MRLDAKYRGFAQMVEADVERLRQRFRARVDEADSIGFDEMRRLATYRRGGLVLFSGETELLARYSPGFGSFHWGWAERPTCPRRLVPIQREGVAQSIEQLSAKALSLDGENEARAVALVAAHLARADGVLELEKDAELYYFALFEVRATTPLTQLPLGFEIPPPPEVVHAKYPSATLRSTAPVANTPAVSLLPPPEPSVTATTLDIAPAEFKPPTEAEFAAVLRAAVREVQAALPEGFARALVLVTVEVSAGKGRFFVHLVASDMRGELHAVEPSRELVDATGAFVLADAQRGNGRWRRMVASIRRTARGANVEFDLRA